MSGGFDPLVPRELDRPTIVPLDADVTQRRDRSAPRRREDLRGALRPRAARPLARPARLLACGGPGAARGSAALRRSRTPRGRAGASRSRRCGSGTSCSSTSEAQRFTPDRFLADARERFGGLDGVVLWHAYPVIGIDDRNQWDFYDVPGLPEAAAALHDAGVRVFVDYNPWDTGTRRGGDDARRARGGDPPARRRRGLPRHAQERRPRLRRRARPGASRDRARGRVEARDRADRRPQPLVGAVVRRHDPARACCVRTCSSGGTCSTTSGAGTATTPAS